MLNLKQDDWITKPLTRKEKQILVIMLQDAGLVVYPDTVAIEDHDDYPCLAGSLSSTCDVVGNTGRGFERKFEFSYQEFV